MIADIGNNYNQLFAEAQRQLPFMSSILAIVWIVNILNWIMRSPLNILGIYPRSLFGLAGIFCAPFLHANFNHLFFNSIPFFVLGMFLLALGKALFIGVTVVIAITQGFAVWLFGRKYLHIGASGVISGYFGFLLGLAYFQPTVVSLILAFVLLYYFGTIILGILPTSEAVSWESHLTGLLAGVALIYVLWHYPQYEITMLQLF